MSSFETRRKKRPVNVPNIRENSKETNRAANWRPPCLTGSLLRAGVLPFLPPAKMALKMPPSIAITTPSTG